MIKGRNSAGNRVTKEIVQKIVQKEVGGSTLAARKIWYDGIVGRLNDEGRGKFLKGSKANLLAVGRERILEARRLAFNHIDELPPHTLEWGLAYIFSFAEWMPYD